MICQYCNEEEKSTREHIIPKGIIDLFPECDLAYSGYNKAYKGEATIKDVCSNCNGKKLGQLDTYGTEFIKRYFIKKYKKNDIVEIEYDYIKLTRWLLKIIYNNERSYKRDIKWFKENINYILNGESLTNGHISLFSGLAINTSCVPDYWKENRQVNITTNPQILFGGIFDTKFYEDKEGKIRYNYDLKKEPEILKINNLFNKYTIRFGSSLFLIILWDFNAEEEYISKINKFINKFYPYKQLKENEYCVKLERCTNAYNYHMQFNIDDYMGMEIADESNCFLGIDKNVEEINKELSVEWDNYVEDVRKKAKQNNKKSKKQKRKKQKQSRKINR